MNKRINEGCYTRFYAKLENKAYNTNSYYSLNKNADILKKNTVFTQKYDTSDDKPF